MKEWYSATEAAGLPGLPTSKVSVLDKAKRDAVNGSPWQERDRAGRGGGKEYHWRSFPAATQNHLIEKEAAENTPASCVLPANHPAVKAGTGDQGPGTRKNLPAVVTQTEPPALTKRQTGVAEARLWMVKQIENRPQGERVQAAIDSIIEKIDSGTAPYASLAVIANARHGATRTLTASTLMKWWSTWQRTKDLTALAPRDNDAKRVDKELEIREWLKEYKPGARATALTPLPSPVPAWLPWFLDAYRKPSKPSIRDCRRALRDGMPEDIALPSYDQLVRACATIPETLREKGRMTGAEYKALLGFARREAGDEPPFRTGQIDGHSFKAYTAHPRTGVHFHPEVCSILEMRFRFLVGVAWGVAESAQTVADTYRDACRWGVLDFVEADRGSGNLAKVNCDPLYGRFTKVGTDLVIEEKGGNPQGHGRIERVNQSIWIRAARTLPTYTGKDMDKVARKQVYTRLERDLNQVKKAGQLGIAPVTSKLLLSAEEFTVFLRKWQFEYNFLTPHSELGKIAAREPRLPYPEAWKELMEALFMTHPHPGPPPDGEGMAEGAGWWAGMQELTARLCSHDGPTMRRNMTPAEAITEAIVAGWRPVMPGEKLLNYLFMPHEPVKVWREEIILFGNRYHSYELMHHHKEELIAAYDRDDASHIWVMDKQDTLICKATWKGNSRALRPVTVGEQADEKRAKTRIKLKQKQIDMITAEKKGALVIDHGPEIEALRGQAVIDLAEYAEQLAADSSRLLLERKELEELVADEEVPAEEPAARFVVPTEEQNRYHLCRALERRLAKGDELTEAAATWSVNFARTTTYRAFRGMEDDFGGASLDITGEWERMALNL